MVIAQCSLPCHHVDDTRTQTRPAAFMNANRASVVSLSFSSVRPMSQKVAKIGLDLQS